LEKLNNLPHKNLFYFGIIVVLIFLSLSYWQLTRYQEDKSIMESIESKDNVNKISVTELNDINNYFEEFTKIELKDNLENISLLRTWYLRSRVHNGENGYHLINLYKTNLNQFFLVNNGWVPLDKNVDTSLKYQTSNFKGRLLDYDVQGVGQDDIPDSEYLFRIDKDFIESETNAILPNYYLTLTEACGGGVECINLEEPYDAPHLSYALQWLFFAACLIIVILRKNRLI